MLVFSVVVVLVILSAIYLKYRVVNTPDKKNLVSTIDAEVSKTMKSSLFPGVVVGVYKGGRTFIKGFGVVSKATPQPPDAETVFQIGSVSKLMTALLLQRLCDEGIVSMDATLGELLDSFTPMSSSVHSVTLRELVTHTSGFPRIPKALGEKMVELAGDEDLMLDPYSYLSPEYVFDYLARAEGKRKAGRFEYSNYGMGLLAHVLEVITGEDYESLVKEKLLLPLGMNHTAITLTPEMSVKLAHGYTGKGLPAPIWSFGALGGAGAFSSTLGDLMTFIEVSLAESGSASELLLRMSEPQFAGKTGIGWMQPSFIDRLIGNRTVVWHNGMVGGYASYLAIDRRTATGVAVLTNQAAATDMLGMMLMRQARTQSWPSTTPSNKSM